MLVTYLLLLCVRAAYGPLIVDFNLLYSIGSLLIRCQAFALTSIF